MVYSKKSLIIILLIIILIFGVSASIFLYKQGKLFFFSKEIEFEQTSELPEEIITPEKLDEVTQNKITELEQKIKELEGKQEIPQRDFNTITVADLEQMLPRVGNLMCSAEIGGQFPIVSEGSASLWVANWDWGRNLILTNYHILTPELDNCDVWLDDTGIYRVNIEKIPNGGFNNIIDFAFLKIQSIAPGTEGVSLPISSLSPTRYPSYCPLKMSLGFPVAVIGFPITAESQIDIPGRGPGKMSNKTVTTGIISSHETNPTINGYPDVNYFVSAKIDKGNSGGLAFSKYNGEICLLGIPTWVERGYFENMGIIQSIHNILNPQF